MATTAGLFIETITVGFLVGIIGLIIEILYDWYSGNKWFDIPSFSGKLKSFSLYLAAGVFSTLITEYTGLNATFCTSVIRG